MKFFLKLWIMAVLLAASGCTDVDYVGQKFAPTPVSKTVEYFKGRETVSHDKYTVIGRFTITVRDGADGYEIERLLLKEARKYGGDAVCLVSTERVNVGAYTANSAEFGAPSSGNVNPGNLTPGGARIQVDSFGKSSELKGEKHFVVNIVIKALLLKDRESVRALLE